MEEPAPPSVTPAAEPAPMGPPSQPLPSKPRLKPEVVAAIVVVVIGAFTLLGFRFLASRKPKAPAVTEKTVPTPTPTPARLPSAIATQSAFLKLETNVASLSAAIKNYVVDDPSLSPPVIELPLGFP